MSKVSVQKKELSEKQVRAVEVGFDVEEVKKIYNVEEDETAKTIIEDLKKNKSVTDYYYTLEQVRAVEIELYMNATLDDPEGKSSVKQKAIDSFLDRVKGKPQTKVDVTSQGEKIETTINIIKPE